MVRLVRRGGSTSTYASTDPFLFYSGDAVPPNIGTVAVLSVPDTTPPTVSAPTINTVYTINTVPHQFTVSYTDNQAIDPASIDGSELLVTGPQAFSQAPNLIGTVSSNSGKTITATYQLSGPGGLWDGGDKYGEYTVSVVANKVADTSGNPVAAGALGTFEHHGQITFTTTATNQIDPVITTNDGSTVRWDLGSTANSLSVDSVESNAPVLTYDNAGSKAIVLEGRLNQVDGIVFNADGLTGQITGDIDKLSAIRILNLSNNSLAMDIASLILPTLQILNIGGGQQQLTGTFDSATAPAGLTIIRLAGSLQQLTGTFDSATAPAGLISLELGGPLQQFTGQFDSATAPAGLTQLRLDGNLQQFTGQFDSATAPAGLTLLSINGDLNQFTGQFDSATAPAGLTQLRLDGNLNQFTGQFDSAAAPAGLTILQLSGDLQQFTGAFNSATAPTGLTILRLDGNLNQFTGQFDSANAPAGLTILTLSGDQQQFTGQFDSATAPAGLTLLQLSGNQQQFNGTISNVGLNNSEIIFVGSPLSNFTGLEEFADKPTVELSFVQLPISQIDIDSIFDTFIADTSLTLTSIDITSVPNIPSGTRIADLAARGVTITQ